MSTTPPFVVDLADDLADLERRLNALSEQRFEPLQVIPLVLPEPKAGPVSFCIIAVRHERVELLAELDYRAKLRADHEGPALPRNGHLDLGRR